jgi:hypothetical protein
MARFSLDRDIRFFEGISRELVDAVVENTAVIFKLIIASSKINIKKCCVKFHSLSILVNNGKI